MKKVSIVGLSILSAFAVALVMFINACTSDPCKDVTCLNGGTCVSGTCNCTDGYEGTDCSTEWRAKFEGTFLLSGTDNAGYTYSNLTTTVASSSTGVLKMIITVAGTYTFTVTLTSSTTFTIDALTSGGFSYTGQGDINGTTLSLTINQTDNATGDVIIFNWSGPKQ